MLEHSKAALVIAVSALERWTRVFDGEGAFQRAKNRPLPLRPSSLSASAGLAVIANVNKTWPQCVCLNVLSNIWINCSAWFISDTLTGLGNGNKSSITCTFQVFKTYSATRVELHIENLWISNSVENVSQSCFGQAWCQCVWLEKQSLKRRSLGSSTWSETTRIWRKKNPKIK